MSLATLLVALLGLSALLALIGLFAVVFKLAPGGRVSAGNRADQSIVEAELPAVEQAIFHVISIGIQAQNAEEKVQSALEASDSPHLQRTALGTASVLMSSLQEKALAAVDDLKRIVPDTVNRMVDLANETPR